ncbi:MAG: type II toxin-antitoxin system VapC family toxin [Gemmataceae bacterium]|nr:type II toxin-antitoxin system VapC family toxin [Gemmataceae bacterium]
MRLLLDTHALVWFVLNDPQLPARARAAIQDPANEVWVSPTAYWELAIKVHLGKWALSQPYPSLMQTALNVNRFLILPIGVDHTARLIGLPDHHRDPFDRLMAVQAVAEGLTLVSADAVFDLYGVPRLWA